MGRVHWVICLMCGALAPAAFAGPSQAASPASERTAAAPAASAPAGAEPARIRQIGPHLHQVGSVVIDAQARTVRCPGRVNMNEGGPIELLACLRRGKTHESVFTLDVEPTDLQVALLLLGLKEGRNPSFKYPEGSPEGERPPGDETLIFVEWRTQSGGETAQPQLQRCRAEQFLRNVKPGGPVAQGTWVFLGSVVLNGRFGADYDGTLITTYHDPLAILELNMAVVNENPYSGPELNYVVDKDRCPPVGTPVELIIQAIPKDKPGGEGRAGSGGLQGVEKGATAPADGLTPGTQRGRGTQAGAKGKD